ncbi:MAG: hypothetical protein JNM86_10670 [Phycisphaerae bacterium]|nr:hypothetical protein [Phycisphaerae bacterium]
MRIPGRNIWRAFRELDPFSDEQCRRFVRSANRLTWSSAVRGVLLFALGAGILLGVLYFLAKTTSQFDKIFRSDLAEWAVLLPLWTAAVTLSPLAVLVLRDWMLIRRIRRLFRTRGQCTGCRYSLIGLPVDESLAVVCPECGVRTIVDVSLGELASDSGGRPRFEPRIGAVADVPTFWTPIRKRFIARLAVGLLIIATVGPLLTLAFYETCLRVQASAASGLKSREAFLALQEKHAEKWTVPGRPGLWGAMARAMSEYERIQLEEIDAVTSGNRSLAGVVDPSRFWDIIPPEKGGLNEAETLNRSERVFARAAARNAVPRAIREGVFAELDAPGLGTHRFKQATFDPAEPIYETIVSDQALFATRFSRLNQARMHAARESGDAPLFAAAARSSFLIARSLRTTPLLLTEMLASAIDSAVFESFILELEDGARPEFVRQIASVLHEWDPESAITEALEAERFSALDCVEWLFSDPARVRWGSRSQAVKDICDPGWTGMFGQHEDRRLGWYWENRDQFNKRFDRTIQDLKLEYGRRQRLQPRNDLALVAAFYQRVHSMTLNIQDNRELEIRSIRVMLALEQYRLEHGVFPDTLDDIAQLVKPDDLRDPFSGKRFGYLKLDYYTRQSCKPVLSPHVRAILEPKPYFLYAPGPDNLDDFSIANDTDTFIPQGWHLSSQPAGEDILLNTSSIYWDENRR